jgi:hypothetical protein
MIYTGTNSFARVDGVPPPKYIVIESGETK